MHVKLHCTSKRATLPVPCIGKIKQPCTRPTKAGEDPRAGRWWWEKNAPKECGIHCPIETGGMEHELEALLENKDR